jgi:hypothetical protein
MFGHLVANTEVWVIEQEVNNKTKYFYEATGTATLWTSRLGRAKHYKTHSEVTDVWESIHNRGTPKQRLLAHILEDAAKG